ncbi:MAG TPA: hypothetical protein VIS99_06050, partial [Terrimicrobiaceae bacterium]
ALRRVAGIASRGNLESADFADARRLIPALQVLAATMRPGSIRALARGVRRPAEQSFPAGRSGSRQADAGTRQLPSPRPIRLGNAN